MTLLFNKLKFCIAVIAATLLLFTTSGCKKESETVDSTAFFNNNVLNKTLTIHLAIDNGANVTSNYSAYTFTCATGGVFTAANNLFSVTGTWAANADFSKVTFTLPTPPSEFIFLNREWTFTKFTTPILELGYSTTAGGDNKILHFQKQ
ncbi:MAG: hypothetical protein KA319_03375 [Ferruginibacter sp.]|nr:hypothetical protein [Ferruginibacter sp.]